VLAVVTTAGCGRVPPGAAKKSPALSPEQQRILEQRGVLSPDEIHRLAGKTKRAVGATGGEKADCHSDYVEPDAAKRIQDERLVQIRVPERTSVDAVPPGE
jgi:phosphomethylpyrimidine synthase